MRRTLCGALLFAALILTGAVHGQGDTAAAILVKALNAAGGEAKLAKFQGVVLKGKGSSHEPGQPSVPFTGTWFTQGADKGRNVMEVEARGLKSFEITVINGDKGWVKQGNLEPRVMDKSDLLEEQERLYLNYIATLAPLKGKEFKLTLFNETKVDGKPAVGFTVSSKGHRDVKFYFDKESSLLVKSERKVKDSMNKEFNEEMYFSNYKEVEGIKIALKFSVKWNGVPQVDAEMSEVKVVEKLDDKLFQKP